MEMRQLRTSSPSRCSPLSSRSGVVQVEPPRLVLAGRSVHVAVKSAVVLVVDRLGKRPVGRARVAVTDGLVGGDGTSGNSVGPLLHERVAGGEIRCPA